MQATSRSFLLFLVVLAFASTPIHAQDLTDLAVGATPTAVAVNPVTNTIYVANYGSGNVTVIDGSDNNTSTVTADSHPTAVAVNPVTNKIYVADMSANLVTVIDGLTNHTLSVSAGNGPDAVAINPVTNKIYVPNYYSNTVTVIDGLSNSTATVTSVGGNPVAVAVNSVTNKIYVANPGNNTVTVIDGATNHTITVGVGAHPDSVAVNQVTNQIYVTDGNSQGITVIDGATNTTSFITTANDPIAVAVNSVTNTIYVANYNSNSVSVIDGATKLVITNVGVGSNPEAIAVNAVTNLVYVANRYPSSVTIIDANHNYQPSTPPYTGVIPVSIAVNPVTDRIYVTNQNTNSVTVISYTDSNALQFVPVAPCRIVDTRNTGGPIPGGTFRNFNVPQLGGCGIPSTAAAYSLNVTAVPNGRLGFLTIWPTGQDQPIVSTMNSLDGRTKANAAILQAGYKGGVNVYVNDTSNVLLDINGYFIPSNGSTLQFYPLSPCRIVDTRNANGDLGGPFLTANLERDFPVLESSCIPQGVGAQAYSFNVTAVPHPTGQRLGFLTVWPKGESQPGVSTLNNVTGTIVANAAIVPAGTGGSVAVFPNNDTDLLIDINGYFAAPGQNGLSLYPMAPCRVIDTRGPSGTGQPFVGELTVNVGDVNSPGESPCAPSINAQAYVFNVTAVPPGPLGFLTLYPDGQTLPDASTLNAKDGAITSNMAIVPTSNLSIDAYANALTQMILDISSYFAP